MTSAASRSTLSWSSPWVRAGILYAVLALINAWPILTKIGTALPSDTGDPGLVTWFLWWNAHAVPLTSRWWDAPIFFPAHGAFAFSETCLGLAPLTTPLQWLGASPVAAYNVTYIISSPAAALASHALAYRLTRRHDAALLAGLAFGFNPYRLSQMPHLHLLMTCWLPLGLFALHRYLADRRNRDLLLLGTCWLLNGLTSGYYLVFFSVLIGLWLLWFVRTLRDWTAILATLAIASLPIVPVFLGYRHYQGELDLKRNVDEIQTFSAHVEALVSASPFAWLPSQWSLQPRPEGELYPGLMIAGLAVAGAFRAWRASPRGRWRWLQVALVSAATVATLMAVISWSGSRISILGLRIPARHPLEPAMAAFWLLGAAVLCDRRITSGWQRRSLTLFYALAALLMFSLALGPIARAFDTPFLSHTPYSILMALPGGHSLRVPARFAMLFVLCLAQGGAIGFARLVRPGATAAVAICAIAIALDGWVPKMKIAAVPQAVDLSALDRKAAVLELPMEDIYADTAAMLRQTVHGRPLLNGFSGYSPPHYLPLQTGLRDLDPTAVQAMQEFGPLLVFIDSSRNHADHYRDFVALVPDANRVLRTPAGDVYALPARHSPPPAVGDPRLPVASVEANNGVVGATALMVDGQVTSAWQTQTAQTKGDRVTVTFDRPVTVSRLELEMGEFHNNYPRGLRVTAVNDSGPGVTLWDHGGAGLAVLAAFADHRRRTLIVELPPAARARQLVLTLTVDDADHAWSIAELRAYGQ